MLQGAEDTAKDSKKLISQSTYEAQKELVEQLKIEWKQLWTERFDDKVRAEGVSVNDYQRLFVEQGTIIHATKDFKVLNFKQILDQHKVENPDRYVQPNVDEGGWNKFIKTQVTGQSAKKQKRASTYEVPKPKGQPKKGGRGWLHST
jgi:hypothetical protein